MIPFNRSMAQHPMTVRAFVKLFAEEPIDHVVEMGVADGGLSIYLAFFSNIYGFKLTCLDTTIADKLGDQLCQITNKVKYITHDVLEKPYLVFHILRDSKETLLLCDNGDKKREFHTYAPYLKPNDIIMAHDYHPTRDKRDWACEIIEKDVEDICKAYNIHIHPLQNLFTEVFWMIKRKE